MIFEVWHADPPNFFANKHLARNFPVGYRHVANVEEDADHRVFLKTQHMFQPWWENEGVTVITPWTMRDADGLLRGHRSTSIGDILVYRREIEGVEFVTIQMYDWIGFHEIVRDLAVSQ